MAKGFQSNAFQRDAFQMLRDVVVVGSSFQTILPPIYADKVVGYVPTSEEIAKKLLDDLLKQAKEEYAIINDEELALVLALALV